MATGGGGGGAHRQRVADDYDRGGGGEEHRFVQAPIVPGAVSCLGADPEEVRPLPPPMPPREPWENPWTQGSSSSFDPMSHYVSDTGLETEMWDLYVQFDGAKFVQKSMPRSDIRYLNLLALMEREGYGICDSIYYVKEEGEGLAGLDLVDSNMTVEEMIRKYEYSKKLVLTMMKDKKRNQAIMLSPMKSKFCQKLPTQVEENKFDAEEERNPDFSTQALLLQCLECHLLLVLAEVCSHISRLGQMQVLADLVVLDHCRAHMLLVVLLKSQAEMFCEFENVM